MTEPHSSYLGRKHLPQLDGLRAVSVVLVVTWHMRDRLWTPFHGGAGVTVFFVLSGYLITTLLSREEQTQGSIALGGFYVRRIFRLLPLYYVSLAVYALVLWALYPSGFSRFRADSLLYLTYNNEFEHGSPFGHTWSLAVEEKFYLIWPVLAFVLAVSIRQRRRLALVLTAVFTIATFAPPPVSYVGLYAPIVAGCLMALLLHHEGTYRRLAPLTGPLVSAGLALVFVLALLTAQPALHDLGVALAAFLLIPGLVAGSGWLGTALSTTTLRWIGERSYAVYLIHPILVTGVGRFLPEGDSSIPVQLARLACVLAVTLLSADVALRLIERPCRNYGRRLAHSRRSAADLPTLSPPAAESAFAGSRPADA